MASPKTAFFFTAARRLRLGRGDCPSEFFYGGLELKQRGWPIEFLEEEDFGLDERAPALLRPLRSVVNRLCYVDPLRLAKLLRPASLARLNAFDAIVVSSNGLALELAALAGLGKLRPRVLAIIMGLLPISAGRLMAFRLRQYLKHVRVLVLSRGEQADQRARLGHDIPIDYLPFGVDHQFWRPLPSSEDDGYALCIGNTHRDLNLLARAWRPEFPRLKIVTIRPVARSEGPVEIIRGDWRSEIMSDVAIRELTQRASFVLVPLQETVHPAGQSATLQALACGKPTVLTRTRGIWDESALVHGMTCMLVRPDSIADIQSAVRQLMRDSELRRTLGANAREVVASGYNAERMAESLGSFLSQAASAPSGPA